MYKTALQNAKTAGESSKARRFERGLKVGENTAWWENENIHAQIILMLLRVLLEVKETVTQCNTQHTDEVLIFLLQEDI